MPFKDPDKRRAYLRDRYAKRAPLERERHAKRRAANPEAELAYQAAWRAAHPENIKAKNDRYTESHPDYYSDYHWEHRPQRLAQVAAWHAEHPTYGKDYREAHPDKGTLAKARRRARKYALPDTWTAPEQRFMLTYWHNACAVCGAEVSLFWRLSYDHWIPLTSPVCPGTVATNMVPLCFGKGGCNNRKNDTDATKWLTAEYGISKAAKILKTIAAYFATVQTLFPSTP